MIAIAHELKLMGTVVTAWLPQRYPPGVLPHAIAYAAYLMEGHRAIALPDAMARFTSSYFGSEDPELVAAFVRLAGIESSRADLLATFWSDPESFAARLTPEEPGARRLVSARTSGIADASARSARLFGQNVDAYESYVLLAELLEFLGRRRILPAAVQARHRCGRSRAQPWEHRHGHRPAADDGRRGSRARDDPPIPDRPAR
jgi:hypothetical protein